jgi:hypothetical protein
VTVTWGKILVMCCLRKKLEFKFLNHVDSEAELCCDAEEYLLTASMCVYHLFSTSLWSVHDTVHHCQSVHIPCWPQVHWSPKTISDVFAHLLTNIMFLDFIHCSVSKNHSIYISKCSVLETRFCLCLHVKPTESCLIDEDSPYLRTPIPVPR